MIVYSYKNYVVLDNGKELIVKNCKGKYENHSHFSRRTNNSGHINLNTVMTCIRLCDSKRLDIKSNYMKEAIMRLTTDTEYRDRLSNKRKKPYYINVNKGKIVKL